MQISNTLRALDNYFSYFLLLSLEASRMQISKVGYQMLNVLFYFYTTPQRRACTENVFNKKKKKKCLQRFDLKLS